MLPGSVGENVFCKPIIAGASMSVEGVTTPSLKAPAAVAILKVEPGGNSAEMA
jgi:hypothetical protein